VFERDPDLTALARTRPVTLRGQQPGRQVEAGGHVEGGKYVVDRGALTGRAGDQREAGASLHGVVDSGATVVASGQGHHDDVVATGPQGSVGELRPPLGVGDQDAVTLDDEVGDQPAADGAGQVDLDPLLAAVQA